MKNKIFYFILLFALSLNISCSKEPVSAFKTVEKYFQLRSQEEYNQLYDFFHDNFKRDISLKRFIDFEKIYRRRFGICEEYKFKKWKERKNFSCGKNRGRMIVLIYDCKYTSGNTEETFTLIKKQDKWKIFDYYLRPML